MSGGSLRATATTFFHVVDPAAPDCERRIKAEADGKSVPNLPPREDEAEQVSLS